MTLEVTGIFVSTAVSAALSYFGIGPIWRVALGRAMTISVACIVVLLPALVLIPSDLAALIASVGTALVSYRRAGQNARPAGTWQQHPAPRIADRLFFSLRSGAYVAVPSIAFYLIWPNAFDDVLVFVVPFVAGTIALPIEFAIVAWRQGENVLAGKARRRRAEEAVLLAEHLAGEAPTDVSAADLDAQLAYRYERARQEAEAEVRRYLPTNPRSAKRMVNHLSLAMAIAEQRGLFRDSVITQHHLGKWIGFSEQWPALGAALTSAPEHMADLEAAANVAEQQEILNKIAPGTVASDEMWRRLHAGVPLGHVLDKLVRFEAG
jgi:hypothetical protein